MRPTRLVPLSVLTASTIIMSVAVPAGPALAHPPFLSVLSPIFGAIGHMLPYRGGHHRRSHHAASHRGRSQPAAQAPAAARQPTAANTASAAPNMAAQRAAGSQLFWPQLADDVFDYVFWPSGNDDRFWAYGYNEIVQGALAPGNRESLRASARGRREAQTTGSVADTPATCASQQGSETADSLIKRIDATVQPTDAQRAALDDLHIAAQRAFEYLDNACPRARAQIPTARLDAMEDRIWAARQALLIMRASVDKFYASLTDAQKARLNGPAVPSGQTTTRAAGCNESNIDLVRMLTGGRGRPDPKQRPALEALQKTSTGLSRLLASSCPATLPASPVDRLDTADRRINSMLYAMATLRAPLDAFSSAPAAPQRPQVSGLRR